MTVLVAMVLLAAWPAPHDPETCTGSPTAPALDHVVLVVRDLDTAAERFARQWFRLKPGRLHSNGLLNRHVKFRDGSAIELMTVRGPPGDLAEEYQALLDDGEGGVFAVLSVESLITPERMAGRLGLEPVRSTSGPWRFLSFPEASAAAAVFFSAGISPVQDPDSLVTHSPAVEALEEGWVEGGVPVARLLAGLGATGCGAVAGPGGAQGVRWRLARGSVVLVPERPGARPRVIGAVLRTASGSDASVQVHPTFWVQYR